MSDSITKWHEMQEDKKIFESPDGGQTVTERPFGGNITDRKVIQQPTSDIKKEAYTILCNHSEEAIRMANKIINDIQR